MHLRTYHLDGGRRGATFLFGCLVAATLALSGCRSLENAVAVDLNEPERRHPIHFSRQAERLLVEVPAPRARLDRGQRADVHQFVADFKQQAGAPLRIDVPSGARGHMAVRDALSDVRSVLDEAGVSPELVRLERSPQSRAPYMLRLSYSRPVAVAPQCQDWSEDVGRDREVVHYPNFGCATQRNFARTVVNARDLRVPQTATPRASERRETIWREYRDGQGSAATPDTSTVKPQAPTGAP